MNLPIKFNNMWLVNVFWFKDGGAVLCYDEHEGFKGYIKGFSPNMGLEEEFDAKNIARWGSKLPWNVLRTMFLPLSRDLDSYEIAVRQLIKEKENK